MTLLNHRLPIISTIFAIIIVVLPTCAQISGIIVLILILVLYIVGKFIPKTIIINGEKTKIVLEYGDLLQKKDGIVIIPVDRNYNTLVDDVIISSKSLHGKFINTIVEDRNKLIEMIASELKTEYNVEKSFKTQKPGMVVPITIQNCTYYLLALSKLDHNYEAQCTPEEYAKAILNLMQYINTNFNGKIVYMPLIGGGLSAVFGSVDKTESLQILVSLIKLSQYSRIQEIHIVINKDSKHRASIYKIE